MLPEGAFVKLPAEPLPISTRLLPRTCSEPSFTQGRLPATALACAATARPTGLDSIWLPLGAGEVAAGGTVGDLPPHGTWWLLGPAPGLRVSIAHALGDAPPVVTFSVGDVSLREADYAQ